MFKQTTTSPGVGAALALAFFCALLGGPPPAWGQATTCIFHVTNSTDVQMDLASTPSGCTGSVHNIDQPGVTYADPDRLQSGLVCRDRLNYYTSVRVTPQPMTEQGTVRFTRLPCTNLRDDALRHVFDRRRHRLV